MKMTPKTIALSAAALLGTLGCFLPFIGGMTLSKLSKMGGLNAPSIMMFLVPFIILLALGGLSAGVFKRVARWQGIVGTLFALGIMMFLDGAVFHGKFKPLGFLTMFSEGGIGAKLVVVGGVAALVTCLMAAIKPDPKTA